MGDPTPEQLWREEESARLVGLASFYLEMALPIVGGPRYLIWSVEHERWWREGGFGYTGLIAVAQRFDAVDAIRHLLQRALSGRPESGYVLVLAPECYPPETAPPACAGCAHPVIVHTPRGCAQCPCTHTTTETAGS